MTRNPIHAHILVAPAVALALACLTSAAVAATADDFKAAFAKAQAAEYAAGVAKNQWTTTETELKAAQAAADGGNFDDAIKHAQLAEALAVASIAQANQQSTAWTKAVIR